MGILVLFEISKFPNDIMSFVVPEVQRDGLCSSKQDKDNQI